MEVKVGKGSLLYLIDINGSRMFLPMEGVGEALDLGWRHANLVGLVLEVRVRNGEPTLYVRDIRNEEIEEISRIADDIGGGITKVWVQERHIPNHR